MPLVLHPTELSEPALGELLTSLVKDLDEMEELVHHPNRPVVDPASLRTAAELLEGVRKVLARPGPRTKEDLASEANLAYATMLAVVDLVKSHTKGPRVPPPRPVPRPGA